MHTGLSVPAPHGTPGGPFTSPAMAPVTPTTAKATALMTVTSARFIPTSPMGRAVVYALTVVRLQRILAELSAWSSKRWERTGHYAAQMVSEGDPAPDFTATTDAGERVSLSDFRGKPVVLYFYPKD